MKLVHYVIAHARELVLLGAQHLALVAIAVVLATLVGVPLGVVATRRASLGRVVLGVTGVLQTVPSLALFGLLLPVLGVGARPALVALFLYSLLPIVRSTVAGIGSVDPSVRDAARGLGLSDGELLREVELPLALGVIASGVRTAAVISVGTATIAAAIGAGGLGTLVFRGLRTSDDALVLAGAIPAALLALAVDGVLALVERALAPGPRSPKRRRVAVAAGVALGLAALAGVGTTVGVRGARPVVVCSKDFTEQVVLGEIVAQRLERAGLVVERPFELGGELCHRALVAGDVDVYVEYTGTALVSLLHEPVVTDRAEALARVRRGYAERFSAAVLDPLGFEDTFAILVRRDTAARDRLETLSDLARVAPSLRAGFGQDFLSRPDGFRALASVYGIRFAGPPREMDLALTYRALADGDVDVIAGNSTDGLIDRLGLVALRDDRRAFPPYDAVPIAREASLHDFPALGPALRALAGTIDVVAMRRMNDAVDAEHRDPRDVARAFLAAHGEPDRAAPAP